jgi:sulfur relay (sulfurtransferase) DsrF/TusC family protein
VASAISVTSAPISLSAKGVKLFKDGEQLSDSTLPDWMNTQEMKQAMNTLTTFSEKERQYHQYQARQEYLREQRTIQLELEQTERALIQERLEKQALIQKNETIRQENQAFLAEIERLKALLAQKQP